VTYEIRVFFEGAQKEIFSSIFKYFEQAELKLCPKKYFQVFLKRPKKTYNTRMFESNWAYVTTMEIKLFAIVNCNSELCLTSNKTWCLHNDIIVK
jgi:hypothetical protein